MFIRNTALVVLVLICLAAVSWTIQDLRRPQPLMKGTVWSVIYGDNRETTGLFREPHLPPPGSGHGGEYGVDMYGILYPTCLVVHRKGRLPGQTLVIPFERIKTLEFGDGGVTPGK